MNIFERLAITFLTTVNLSSRQLKLKDLGKGQLLAVLMLFGFAGYVILDQYYWWRTREDYSFGFLVPVFVGFVIYDRWPLIVNFLSGNDDQSLQPKTIWQVQLLDWLACIVFMVSIGLFLVGALLRSVTGPQNPASLAIAAGFSGLFLSTVFIVFKERPNGDRMSLKSRLSLTGLFLFPALIWLISAPLVSVIETKIRVFLYTQVAFVVFNVFDLMGFEIDREGNTLFVPGGRVDVAEACSGIYSLTACIFVGSFLAVVFLDRFWKKVILVLVAMALAVLTNLFRSLFLTSWAYFYGPDAINDMWSLPLIGEIGTVHDVMGLAVLGITSICLLLLLPVFNFKLKPLDNKSDQSQAL